MLALRVGIGALIVLLAGCASDGPEFSGPQIFSNEDPAADFSAYRTYGFLEPLGTDEPDAPRSLLSSLLMNAVNGEMQRRGFRRSDDPDLLVNFAILARKTQLTSPSSPRETRHPRRRQGRHGQWRGYEATTVEYLEGTLAIDLVDAGANTVVWEGLAQGPMQASLREATQERVTEVVKLIFERFSHQAK